MEPAHDQTDELSRLLEQDLGDGPQQQEIGPAPQDCTTSTAIALLEPSPEIVQIMDTVKRLEAKIDALSRNMTHPGEPSSSGQAPKRPSHDNKTKAQAKKQKKNTPFDGPFQPEWINIGQVVKAACEQEDRIPAFEALRRSAKAKMMEYHDKKGGNHEWTHLIPGLARGPHVNKHKGVVCFYSFGCREKGKSCYKEHLCLECCFIADKKEYHKYGNSCPVWRMLFTACNEA